MRKYCLIILLAFLVSGCQGDTPAVEESGPLLASGTISATEVRIASELGGRILELRAGAGTEVHAGDALATLDSAPFQLQLTPAEAGVQVAQAKLDLLKAGSNPAEIEAARATLALAEAQRDGTLTAWENAQATVSNPQELNTQLVEAGTKVKLAAQGVEKAKADLTAYRSLRDSFPWGSPEYLVADQQVKAGEAAFAGAQVDEQTTQTLLDQLTRIRNYPLGYIVQAHIAEGQHLIAEEGITVAQARLDDLLAGPTPEELVVAAASVRQAEAEANVLRVQVEKCTLTSPMDGIVLEQTLRAGELAAPAATILTLADLSEVTLEVYVPENRIGHVQLGQTVQVAVDSFPDKVFTGRVARIGDQPEFTPRNVATAEGRLNTFYAVEVHLPNPEGLLKPGMPADATF